MGRQFIPFIRTKPRQPRIAESNLYDALKPAFPGLSDVVLLPNGGSDFYGSNIELQRCLISSGVHPAMSARSEEADGIDRVTLEIAYSGCASIRSLNGSRHVIDRSKAVLAMSQGWTIESTDYGGVVIVAPRNDFLEKLSLALDEDARTRDLVALDVSTEAGYSFLASLRSLQGLYNESLVPSGAYDEFLINALVLFTAQGTSNHFTQLQGRMDVIVAKAREIIRKNLSSNMTVDELARTLDVSERYLQIAFQSVMQMSPKQWMIAEKLDQARLDLVTSPNLSITVVSERYGFSSPPHFTTAFKKKFGSSPRMIRGR